MDDVQAAWTTRARRVQSFRFAWTENEFCPKGSLISAADVATILGKPGNEIPPADAAFQTECSVAVDGDRFRYAAKGARPQLPDGDLAPRDYVSAFDGKVWRDLCGPIPTRSCAQGSIASTSVDEDLLTLKPIIWAYRFQTPKASIQLDKYRVIAPAGSALEKLVVLQEDISSSNVITTLWLDPARDFLVTRCTMEPRRRGRLTKIDISYVRSDGNNPPDWVPSEWRIVCESNQRLLMSLTARATEHAINPRIDADQFNIVFPPGAIVQDAIANTTYIVRENGKNRAVLPSERTTGYDELLATEPGPSRRVLRPWLIAANVGIIALLVILIALRRRAARKQER